jgi:hypothetical protein
MLEDWETERTDKKEETKMVRFASEAEELEATGEWHVVTDSDLFVGGEVDYGK